MSRILTESSPPALTDDAATPRRAGRPRDDTIDARALQAARDLLIEQGFAATTIQAVAERSGVHASAIYRRWSSRYELIEEAALADLAPGRLEPTGDLGQDLRRFVLAYVATFDSPLIRAAMPGLLARPAKARRSPESWQLLSVRPQFRAILAAAPPGTVDAELDPDDVFDLLLGAVLVRVMVPTEVRPAQPVERTVELIRQLLAPR